MLTCTWLSTSVNNFRNRKYAKIGIFGCLFLCIMWFYALFLHFFAKIFAYVRKKQYLCTRFYVGSDLRRLHRPAIRIVDVLPPLRLKLGLNRVKQCCEEYERVSLAQLVEQLTLNQWVESSSLSGDTKKDKERKSRKGHSETDVP